MQIGKGTVVKFKFDDGSTLDWRITEPCTVEHLVESIEKWAQLNKPKIQPSDQPIRREGDER